MTPDDLNALAFKLRKNNPESVSHEIAATNLEEAAVLIEALTAERDALRADYETIRNHLDATNIQFVEMKARAEKAESELKSPHAQEPTAWAVLKATGGRWFFPRRIEADKHLRFITMGTGMGAVVVPLYAAPAPTLPAIPEGAGTVPQSVLDFLQILANQTPEKPDHWASCSQCEHNAADAEELLEAMAAAPEYKP